MMLLIETYIYLYAVMCILYLLVLNITSRKRTSMLMLTIPLLIRFSRIADIEPNMKAYTIRNRAGERRLTGLQGKSSIT